MRNSLFLFLFMLAINSCMDRLSFDVGELETGILVVDGQITDEPGPYTVRLFKSANVDDILNFSAPVLAKQVSISSDAGENEILKEADYGVYETDPNGIRGEVRRKYTLKIELNDGRIFESTGEELRPSGTLDSLYWELEKFQPSDVPTQYGFRLYVDAHNLGGDDNFVRWRFMGTYRVVTNPELHEICPCDPDGIPDPRECSGVIFYKSMYLQQIAPCKCCICWVNQVEQKPTVLDNSFVTQGNHKKVEVGYVPMNQWTFFSNRYLVEVKQMSLSKNAYAFLKTIKDQKEGAGSLFQPSYGKVHGNIAEVNGQSSVLGLFYASSVKRKLLWITADDVPVSIPVPLLKTKESCLTAFPNSFITQPPDWK